MESFNQNRTWRAKRLMKQAEARKAERAARPPKLPAPIINQVPVEQTPNRRVSYALRFNQTDLARIAIAAELTKSTAEVLPLTSDEERLAAAELVVGTMKWRSERGTNLPLNLSQQIAEDLQDKAETAAVVVVTSAYGQPDIQNFSTTLRTLPQEV